MSVTAASGFVAAGTHAGIKPSGRPDLSLVATANGQPVTAAGVFTTNLVAAAPVQVSRRHLAEPRAAAVILNSGNANAATGGPGLGVAERACALVAEGIGSGADDVLVCSTGLIGIPLGPEPFEDGVPKLVAALAGGPEAGGQAAAAIMTTDTVAKEAVAVVDLDGASVTVGGMAKGAAMLSPAMATMLAVLTTDAAVDPGVLQTALTVAVDASFNRMTTDGSRSTNDTVLILASGAAGNPLIGPGDAAGLAALTGAITEVCASLADQMASDAEGATKFVRIRVQGARSDGDAHTAARAVAESQLVKCSLYGEDPYWGRILSEMGASGAYLEPDRVSIAYGNQPDGQPDGQPGQHSVTVCAGGVAAPHDAAALKAVMADRDIVITADLGLGDGSAVVTTVDLGPAYIDENMGTS